MQISNRHQQEQLKALKANKNHMYDSKSHCLHMPIRHQEKGYNADNTMPRNLPVFFCRKQDPSQLRSFQFHFWSCPFRYSQKRLIRKVKIGKIHQMSRD